MLQQVLVCAAPWWNCPWMCLRYQLSGRGPALRKCAFLRVQEARLSNFSPNQVDHMQVGPTPAIIKHSVQAMGFESCSLVLTRAVHAAFRVRMDLLQAVGFCIVQIRRR